MKDEKGNVIVVNMVRLPFSSRMTEIFQGSGLNEIVNEMFAHMNTQIENPALANSRFKFNEVLFLDINFYQLNLTRGSSYLSLPDQMASKRTVINPKTENDGERFKWAVTAALHYVKIKLHPKRISNLRKYVYNYDWSGLEFPVAIKGISEFEEKNDVIINVLGGEDKKVYILRGKKDDDRKKVVNLLLVADGEFRHYTVIRSLSRLLRGSNSKHGHKQHFCMNCLQGFPTEISRDKHFEHCKDNETVRTEMPKEASFMKFYNGQNQFKVPFVMYADFEAVLKPIEAPKPNPEESYNKVINQHIPSGFCVYCAFAYGKV